MELHGLVIFLKTVVGSGPFSTVHRHHHSCSVVWSPQQRPRPARHRQSIALAAVVAFWIASSAVQPQ